MVTGHTELLPAHLHQADWHCKDVLHQQHRNASSSTQQHISAAVYASGTSISPESICDSNSGRKVQQGHHGGVMVCACKVQQHAAAYMPDECMAVRRSHCISQMPALTSVWLQPISAVLLFSGLLLPTRAAATPEHS